jgi:hypothetical protein
MKSFLKPDPKFRNGYKDPKRMAAIHDLYCVVCFAKGLKQTTKTIAHHSIGGGFKVSLCELHHNKGENGEAIHETPLHE